MRSLRVVLPAVVCTLSVISLHAQTADDIINKNIEAMGGKDKLSSIKTLYIEYDMDAMGNQGSGVTYIVNGKGFRNEVDFGGQKAIECITDKGGWGVNPFMGKPTPEAMPEDVVKARQGQFDLVGPLFNYAAKGNTVELQGHETLNGVNAWKLKLKDKQGNEGTFWIDPTTYYILKTTNKASINGQDVETTVVFSNYTKTDYGIVVPGGRELTMAQGFTVNMTNKKVEVNKDVDMKIFDMQK
jgi:outer membrane lipoprotein-sorting protein